MNGDTHSLETHALVDFDNARPSQRDARAMEVEGDLLAVVRCAVALCRVHVPNTTDLTIRLYGGWLCQRGQFTSRANRLLGCLSAARSRFNGIRVHADLALGLAAGGHSRLTGTLRTDRTPIEQKMVDTLLAMDAIHFASGGPIIILSDDDDFVPPLLACSSFRQGAVIACRERAGGRGLNDAQCRAAGVIMEAWGEFNE